MDGAIWLSKIIDLIVDYFLKIAVYGFKRISPVKIEPNSIPKSPSSERWDKIYNLKISNRLNDTLYNLFIAGQSASVFNVKIISDDSPKGKTVEYMNINTNHLVFCVKNNQTGNYFWILRIHKFNPKEVLNLNLKIVNEDPIYFKIIDFSRTEIPIEERKDGVVKIPYTIEESLKKIRPLK